MSPGSASSVVLRPLTLHDAIVLSDWAADDNFCRAAEWTVGLPAEEHHAFHSQLIASPPQDLIRLGAVHKGRLIGYIDLHGEESDRRELGFLIGPRPLWGQGIGLAVARAGLVYGFRKLGLRQVWAEALDANRASVRILERLGMTETGPGAPGTYLAQPTRYRQFALQQMPD